MRLSEKLAKTDSRTTQLTLRVKTSVAAQLKKDAEGSDVSVNELASRLLETALELPSWTDEAIALVNLHLREAARPIQQAALQRLREAARNVGVDPELAVCIGAGLRAAVLTRHRVKEGAHRAPAQPV